MTVGPAHPEFPIDINWDATVIEWLAGLFRSPPTSKAVASYQNGLGAMLLEDLVQQTCSRDGAMRMQSALIGVQTVGFLTQQLGTTFMLLFEGAGGPRTVSPFESAHTGTHGRLFQASAAAMDEWLHQSGLCTLGLGNEPADHLSIELALLARFLRTPPRWHEAGALLDRHLLTWVPGFAREVEAADRTGFYGGAARLLSSVLARQYRAICAGSFASTRTQRSSDAPSGALAC